jgi:NADH dehydrogenase
MIQSAARTVALTGASGFVGRTLTRELLRRGFRVRALVRERDRARDTLPVHNPGLSLVMGDALDARSPSELVEGADACINLIGILRQEPGGRTFAELHTDTTRALVQACLASGTRRFVQMSALGVSGDADCEYRRTKWAAELLVRHSGLDWTIFRPGLIHGPESGFIQSAAEWASGQSPPYLFLPYFTRREHDDRVPAGPTRTITPRVQPVAVEDVAAAFAECLNRPESIGEIYPLVGPETLTWPRILTLVRDHVPGSNRSLVPWGIPSEVAAAVAKLAAAAGLAGLLPFDHGMAVMGGQDSTAGLDKVRAELGLEPRPFTPTFIAYAPRV